MKYIKFFSEISKHDVKEVGGKGASLGEMTKAGIPVPPGFVVTAQAYKDFSQPKADRSLDDDSEIPADLIEEIYKVFDELGAERVAVRSSAVAEDSSSASWAGQLESYLNTKREDLIGNIRECWNSIKSERALSYASQQNVPEEDLVVAVVVQKMVEAESAGVMFTVNPISKNPTEMMIESCFGLGEKLVQGEITPDNYIINIETWEITSKDIQTGDPSALTDEQVIELAKLGKKIEEHYDFPCDIEWAMEDGKFYIVQSRPITA